MHMLTGCLFLSAGIAIAADDIISGTRILLPGTFHGDEVAEPIGKNWFALIDHNNQYRLEHVSPRIETVYDPVLDDESNKSSYTGKSIEVSKKKPLLLIRSKWLKQGPIVQAEITGETVKFGGKIFTLDHKCNKKPNANGLKDCKVYLNNGISTQFVASTSEGESDLAKTVFLEWAGDIDRDGKLDLILRVDWYNNSSTQLYLSSQAKKTNLIKKVAEFSSQGC